MTVKERYKDTWENVQPDCLLCEMEKRTEWYLETRDWLVAEKLDGGPFVVYKRHTEKLSDEEWENMERIVNHVFEDFELVVRMNLVEDHFHAHIVTDEQANLEGE